MSDENVNVEAEPASSELAEEVSKFREQFDAAENEQQDANTAATESAENNDEPPADSMPPAPLRIPEVLFGSGVIILWLILVSAGVIVNSSGSRGVIDGSYEANLQRELDALNGTVAVPKEEKQTETQVQTQLQKKQIETLQALLLALEDNKSAANMKKKSSDTDPGTGPVNPATGLPGKKKPENDKGKSGESKNKSDSSKADKSDSESKTKSSDSIELAKKEELVAAKISKRIRIEKKLDALGFWTYCGAWTVVLTSFTIPNLAFLSCLAAIGGEFCRRAKINEIELEKRILAYDESRESLTYTALVGSYTAAGMRGFVVYLLVIGGLFLIDTDALVAGSATHIQSQYIRMAGMLSVFAFITGYDTAFFRRSLERIVGWVSQTPTPSHNNA